MFLPPCYAALSVLYNGSVSFQRWSLLLLLDGFLLYHLARLALAPTSALFLALCLALSGLAAAALYVTALGYNVLHAALCFALLALTLAVRMCGRPVGSSAAPAHSPVVSPWLALFYLFLSALFAQSSVLRLLSCDSSAGLMLPWLDLALSGCVGGLGAAVYCDGLSASSPAAAPAQGSEAAQPLLDAETTRVEKLKEAEEGGLPLPPPSLHDASSALSVCTFSWLDTLFTAGFSRQLNLSDLEGLPQQDGSALASAVLQSVLEARPASLARALLQCYGRAWVLVGALQVGCVLTALAAPLALKGLLEYLQGGSSSAPGPLTGLAWTAALAAVQGASALCTTQLNYWVTRLQLRVRAGLVSALQRRVLTAPLQVRRGLSSGTITNLVSVDVDRVLNLIPSFHQFWTLPLQVIVVVVELQAQVSYAALGGVGVLCVMVPINICVARWLGSLTAVMMKARDARVLATGEVLTGIRAVKLSGWEIPLLRRIAGHRAAEFAALTARKYLDAVCVWCWASTPLLMALTTFALTLLLPGEQAIFTPAKVWASLAMLNLLIFPLNAFPWVLSGLLEARVSLQRLDDFLLGAGVGAGGKSAKPDSTAPLPPLSSLSFVSAAPSAAGGGSGAGEGEALLTARGDFVHAQCGQSEEAMEEGGEGTAGAPPAAFVLRLGGEGVSVARGECVCVCGAMASGKTSLILALLGELCSDSTAPTPGHTRLSRACTLAYAPQTPWIRDGTLQDNIYFGEVEDEGRLERVLIATGLQEEARERGLCTQVTETMLSGGQRARLGLARALYNRSSLLLLDSVTSALDAKVATAVWPAVVAFCRLEGRACVAVVNDARFLSGADRVLVLSAVGGLAYSGAPGAMPADIFAASGLNHGGEGTAFAAVAGAGEGQGQPPLQPPASALASEAMPGKAGAAAASTEAPEAAEEEFREKGFVKGNVLMDYASSIGWGLAGVVLVSALAMQATRNGADAWLSVWSSSTVENLASDPLSALSRYLVARQWGVGDFLLVYAGLAGANFLLTALRAWSFARAGLVAAAALHTRLLVGIVGTAQLFHDATPSGRLLNRLSGDVFAIDDSLPFSLNIFLAQAVGLLGTVVILGVSTYGLFLLLLPILCFSFLRLQTRYRATSRELKRLDAVTRSPLLTQFSDLRKGEAILLAASLNRAQAASPVEREKALGLQLLDHSQRTTFASGMAGQWLGLRLQMLGILVLSILCAFCFLLRLFSLASAAALYDDGCCPVPTPPTPCASPLPPSASSNLGSASVAGLILSLSLPVVYQLQGLLGAFVDTEKEFISCERALEFAALPPEDAASVPAMALALQGKDIPDASGSPPSPPPHYTPWRPPHHGLTLDAVSVTYPGAPSPALSLSLTLAPGARLGIVGRTGSGKSTLLSLLWRLVPFEGRALLGGMDLTSLPIATLRSSLCIVPQEPLLLGGTLRFNLDPWGGSSSDAELEAAIEKCGLRASLQQQLGPAAPALDHAPTAAAAAAALSPSLLDMHIEEGGKNFSLGQQQLVCLSRAMLRSPPLLALDEATASVDAPTHALLQAALKNGFPRTTVILVAHKLDSVLGCDQVLVLSQGKAVEMGPPQELLARGGAFATLVAESKKALGAQ